MKTHTEICGRGAPSYDVEQDIVVMHEKYGWVGYHAFIDAEWLPEEPRPSGRRKKKRPAAH